MIEEHEEHRARPPDEEIEQEARRLEDDARATSMGMGTEPPPEASPGKLVTTEEAAEIIGISPSGVKQAIQKGRLAGAFRTEPQGRYHKGRWLIPEAEVRAYVKGAGAGVKKGEGQQKAPSKIRATKMDPTTRALLKAQNAVFEADRALRLALSTHSKHQARLKEAMEG